MFTERAPIFSFTPTRFIKSIAGLLITAIALTACGSSTDSMPTPTPAATEAPTAAATAAMTMPDTATTTTGNVLVAATDAVTTTTASAMQSPLAVPIVGAGNTSAAAEVTSTTAMTAAAMMTMTSPMTPMTPTVGLTGTIELSPSATITAVVEVLPAPAGIVTVPMTTEVVTTSAASPFDLSKISLNPAGVAVRVHKVVKPAIANAPDQPPTANGLPTRVQYTFDRDRLSAYFNPRERQLIILPVAEYRALFANDANALTYFDTRLATLKTILATKPPTVTLEIPIFPPLGAAQVFAAQIKYLSFEGGTCVRFVTAYAQDVSPITDDKLFYTCQGLTSDGKHLVSFVYPVSSAATPASYRRVPPAVLREIEKDPAGYFKRITAEINALPTRGFRPYLSRLDVVMESLTIAP